MTIPHLALLRQTAPQPVIADVAVEVRRQWLGSRLAGRLRRGDRVAVAIHLRYDDEPSAVLGFEAIVRGALSDPIENRTQARSATAEAGAKAARGARFCSERELRGPFVIARSGRDLGVTLGPYTRDKAATRSAASCAMATTWAESIAKSR